MRHVQYHHNITEDIGENENINFYKGNFISRVIPEEINETPSNNWYQITEAEIDVDEVDEKLDGIEIAELVMVDVFGKVASAIKKMRFLKICSEFWMIL